MSMKRLSVLLLLAGCTDAPAECGGQTLEALRAQAKGRYEVVYTDTLPRGTMGRTVKLDANGPALVFVASDVNRITRDGTEAHEIACHVLGNVPHPVKPPPSNIAKPDRGARWDRIKMGAPDPL